MDEDFLNELSIVPYNVVMINKKGKKWKINPRQDNYVARFICSNTFFDCDDDAVLLDKICEYLLNKIYKYNELLDVNRFNDKEIDFLVNRNNLESGLLHWVRFKEKDLKILEDFIINNRQDDMNVKFDAIKVYHRTSKEGKNNEYAFKVRPKDTYSVASKMTLIQYFDECNDKEVLYKQVIFALINMYYQFKNYVLEDLDNENNNVKEESYNKPVVRKLILEPDKVLFR